MRLLLVILALLVTAGCEIEASAPPEEEAAAAEPVPTFEGEESMASDQRAAVNAVNAFWEAEFPEQFGRTYTPPTVAGPYVGTNGPTCAGQPSVPFNAIYCPPGDFIAWDDQLMASGYSQIGDAWVYLIIAHEWGHAIQARLDRDRVSVQAELQADCLAGAALAGAAEMGLIVVEPGDDKELAETLAAVADDYPWTKESDHGSAEERTGAFNAGAGGGVPACA
jgi:uncharacterized protein